MKCPIDETELQMNERQGVEIDYCPKCRGVWLDRGELDKIIERSEQFTQKADNTPTGGGQIPPQMTQTQYPPQMPYGYDKHGGYGKRRKGLLGELFDF